MRKEIIFAVLAGIFVGVIVAFGVWRLNSKLKSDNSQQSDHIASTDMDTQDSANTQSESIDIALTKYENGDVITESPIKITGVTKTNSFIVVSAEDEDYTAVSDMQGEFNIDIDLVAGVNDLLIKAIDDKGNSKEEKLRLVYSSEFAKYLGEE